MVDIKDIIQEIVFTLINIIAKGESKPQKIIVSHLVYSLLMGITTMPRSIEYINGVFYIAGIPVEQGDLDDPKGDIWFRIV